MTNRDSAVYAPQHGTYRSPKDLVLFLLGKQGVHPLPANPYDAWHAWRGHRQGLCTECPAITQDDSHDAWLSVAYDCVHGLETEESFVGMLRHIAGCHTRYGAGEIVAILGGYMKFMEDFCECPYCHEDYVRWEGFDGNKTWPDDNIRFCSRECRHEYGVAHGYTVPDLE